MSLSISLVLKWCSDHPNILSFDCLSSCVPCAPNRRPTLFSLRLRALLLRGPLVPAAFPTPLPHSIRVALALRFYLFHYVDILRGTARVHPCWAKLYVCLLHSFEGEREGSLGRKLT